MLLTSQTQIANSVLTWQTKQSRTQQCPCGMSRPKSREMESVSDFFALTTLSFPSLSRNITILFFVSPFICTVSYFIFHSPVFCFFLTFSTIILLYLTLSSLYRHFPMAPQTVINTGWEVQRKRVDNNREQYRGKRGRESRERERERERERKRECQDEEGGPGDRFNYFKIRWVTCQLKGHVAAVVPFHWFPFIQCSLPKCVSTLLDHLSTTTLFKNDTKRAAENICALQNITWAQTALPLANKTSVKIGYLRMELRLADGRKLQLTSNWVRLSY